MVFKVFNRCELGAVCGLSRTGSPKQQNILELKRGVPKLKEPKFSGTTFDTI